MRVLVTGGAGFIGSHLCERLVDDGHHVTAVDDLSTGTLDNLRHILDHQHFRLEEQDVCDPLPDVRFEQVYHLASPASPVEYQRRPVDTLRACTLGTMRVLDQARVVGGRILLASTSEVYGDPVVHPQPESYRGNCDPMGPRSCYDEGKRCAEAMCASYAKQYGVNTTVARLFNTYGPRMRQDDGRVVPTFVRQALDGDALTVHGSGLHTRSYCYVDDMVDGLVRLISSDVSRPVNLGSESEVSVIELARAVIEATGSRSEIAYVREAEDDPKRRRPDTSLARSALGWSATTPLRLGLMRTVRWFGERRAEARHAS